MDRSAPGCLAGCQTVLSPSSRTPQKHLVSLELGERWEQSPQNTETECDCKRPGPCAFSWVTNLGPRRGKEERVLLGRGAG